MTCENSISFNRSMIKALFFLTVMTSIMRVVDFLSPLAKVSTSSEVRWANDFSISVFNCDLRSSLDSFCLFFINIYLAKKVPNGELTD